MLEKLETTQNIDDLDLVHTGSTIIASYYKDDVENPKHLENISNETNEDSELIATIEDKAAEERRITRIIDFRMMPLFCIFYFMDYLDRANIGNATYVYSFGCNDIYEY